MSDDKELIGKMKEHIELLEAELERLVTPPLALASMLKDLGAGRVLVASGGSAVIVDLPFRRGKDGKPMKTRVDAPDVGTQLLVNGGGAILEAVDVPLAGAEATVKRVFDGDMMEIESGMGAVMIFKGMIADCVKPGDTVQLDRSGMVALKVIEKDRTAYSVETATGVSWADIGGQEQAKSALQEAVEGPVKHAKLYRAYGKRPLKGVLLSGPPGCGKTLLAKATANAIREAHGAGESQTAFIYVKGPEVLNMWVGNTEGQIRGLFARAKEHHATYGYPAVIFIDEADAILGKRGSHHGSVLASTVVPTFLAEMDGMVDSGAFVLLATNRQDTLDPAIVREGRIDRKVHVGRPLMPDAAKVLSIHIRKTKANDPDELAGLAAAELFSEIPERLLYRVGLKGKSVVPFYIRHLVSGAMLAGVVDVATSIAIQRDAATGKASGLTKDDVTQAVVQVTKANHGLNHDDALMAFAEEQGAEIEGVQRIAA